ncbi:Protein ssh4 [Saitoella coloradoensis]
MLVALLASLFGTLGFFALIGLGIWIARNTRRGRRIMLGGNWLPGQFDDEAELARQEAEAVEHMDEISRLAYFRAKAYQQQNPPESVPTDISLSQYLSIQEKGVSAWEFVPDLEVANCFVEARTEIQFYDRECSVQTNLPIPKQNEVYYWEAKMYDLPESTVVSVGLTTKPYPLFRLPGWNRISLAYTSAGHRLLSNPFRPTPLLKLTQGDVIGIGYRPRTGSVFFTRNGRKTEGPELHGYKTVNLFPTVGANGPCSVHVNFGQGGFVYIEANVKKWGLAPMVGTLGAPPAYGVDGGSILLETATTPGESSADRPPYTPQASSTEVVRVTSGSSSSPLVLGPTRQAEQVPEIGPVRVLEEGHPLANMVVAVPPPEYVSDVEGVGEGSASGTKTASAHASITLFPSPNPPAFSLIVLGPLGGPGSRDLSSYFVKSRSVPWQRNCLVGLDAGVQLTAVEGIMERWPIREGPFFDAEEVLDRATPLANAAVTITDLLGTTVISHAHLDHIAALVTDSPIYKDCQVAGTDITIENLKTHIFNDIIWPDLAREGMFSYTSISTSSYTPISGGLSVWAHQVAHGGVASSALFIRDDATTREFLWFGDVEPDAVAAQPRNHIVWEAAARKFLEGLSVIMIECSYSVTRPIHLLFGHLSPPHLIHELLTFARYLSELSPRPTTPRTRRSAKLLDGLVVVVTHIKLDGALHGIMSEGESGERIVNECRVLAEEAGIGEVRFVRPKVGDRYEF